MSSQPNRNHTFNAHISLFLVNSLYAAGHIIAKGVMPNYLTPTTFIFFRIVGATILFWTIKSFLPKEKIEKKDYKRFFICALFGITINQLFFFHGLNLSSSINSGIIMTTNPILVVVLGYFIIKEKITGLKLFGVALGAIGAILLTVSGNTAKGESFLGDLFLLINSISYAIYLLIAKPLMQKYSPITVMTYVFTIGSIYMLLYPPTYIDTFSTDFSSIPSEIWLKIMYIIIGVTFFTYLLTIYALKYLSPSVSSSYIYFQPMLVIVFAYVFYYLNVSEDYRNTITIPKIGYMLLIFLGVWITSYATKRNKKSLKA